MVWTILVSWKLSFQWSVHFGQVGHINGKPRKHGTPAECYVYRKQDAHSLALQRSAMCWNHGPSAGAETLVHNVAINILLRWSKEKLHSVHCVLI